MNFDMTLDQLENTVWGEPTFSSSLIRECHRLRTVPLNDYTPADLRIMIGQNIGLKYLIPLAIDVLEVDPLIKAYYFEGDLLSSVLRADECYWQENKALYKKVKNLVSGIIDFEYAGKLIKEALNQFNWNKV